MQIGRRGNFEKKLGDYFKKADLPFIDASNIFFPYSFKDDAGQTFNAKPDFCLPGGQHYVEVKDYKLNTVASTTDALKKLQDAVVFKTKTFRYIAESMNHYQLSALLWAEGKRLDSLKLSWSNSIYKQAIVSDKVKEEGGTFQVWFSGGVKLSPQQKNLLGDLSIDYHVIPKIFEDFDFKSTASAKKSTTST